MFQTSDFAASRDIISIKLDDCLPLAYPSSIYKHFSSLMPLACPNMTVHKMHIKPGSKQTLDLNNRNISMLLLPNAAIKKNINRKQQLQKAIVSITPPPPPILPSPFSSIGKNRVFFKLVHLCCKHQLDRILTILVRNCFPIVFSFIGCVQLFPLWESSVADVIKSTITTL